MRLVLALMLALPGLCIGCSRPASSGFLKPGALALVVIGQSSRADVMTALGRPLRTERSSAGESWGYDGNTDTGPSPGLVSGATTASAVAGTFVPYVGLLGTGVGLANTARTTPDTMSLKVEFGVDGIVVECLQSSTAMPSGLPGSASDLPADCTRPHRAPG